MALQKFRRHTRKCTKNRRPHERQYDDCHCNYSVEGMLGGKFIRKTAGTPYADKANALIRAAEKAGKWTDVIQEKKMKMTPSGVLVVDRGYTVDMAADDFMDYIKSTTDGKVAYGTVINYQATMRDFTLWCRENNVIYAKDLTPTIAVRYKDSWGRAHGKRNEGLGNITQQLYVSRLKAFGEYLEERSKCPINFAAKLKSPNAGHIERPPFTPETFAEIERQAMIITENRPAEVSGFRVLTHIYLMRYAAMAIGDATLANKDQIVGDEIHYYREKTKKQPNRVLVKVPLPGWLLDRLKTLEEKEGLYDGKYFFAKGVRELPGAGTTWRHYLTPILDAAGVEGCPSHRFRHTFAEDMLTRVVRLADGPNGEVRYGYIPVSVVALWLGHADEATTTKHYNATIQRRNKLGSDLMRGIHAEDAKGTAA